MKLSHIALGIALASGVSAGVAQAATGVGSIGHDIKFGGIIAESAPKWVWALPQQTIRIDLKDGDGVVANSTKTWDVLQNRQPYRFLEGYMTATVPGLALSGLNPQVTYLQDYEYLTRRAILETSIKYSLLSEVFVTSSREFYRKLKNYSLY